MKLKINKCSTSYWWYHNSIDEEYEIDFNDCTFEKNTDGTFIWFKYNISEYIYSLKAILLTDTNYYSLIRKQKLSQLCSNQEI